MFKILFVRFIKYVMLIVFFKLKMFFFFFKLDFFIIVNEIINDFDDYINLEDIG